MGGMGYSQSRVKKKKRGWLRWVEYILTRPLALADASGSVVSASVAERRFSFLEFTSRSGALPCEESLNVRASFLL